jgi:hypothetical protein
VLFDTRMKWADAKAQVKMFWTVKQDLPDAVVVAAGGAVLRIAHGLLGDDLGFYADLAAADSVPANDVYAASGTLRMGKVAHARGRLVLRHIVPLARVSSDELHRTIARLLDHAAALRHRWHLREDAADPGGLSH